MRHCLVAGGSGFIGGYIAEELARQGDRVIILDIAEPNFSLPENVTYVNGDIRYPETLERVFQKTAIEEVYDVAGALGTAELQYDMHRAIDINIKGTVNLLQTAARYGVKRYFYPTKPNDWLNTYTITKFGGEQFCHLFRETTDMSVTVLRWMNAYGPRQHLIPVRKLIPNFIARAILGKPLEVFGTGEQTVDLIHVRDIARIAVQATRAGINSRPGEVLDVGSGTPLTVNEVAAMILKLAGREVNSSTIVHRPMRSGEPIYSKIVANLEPLRKVMDIGDMIPLEEGLQETFEYYRSLGEDELRKAVDYYLEVL